MADELNSSERITNSELCRIADLARKYLVNSFDIRTSVYFEQGNKCKSETVCITIRSNGLTHGCWSCPGSSLEDSMMKSLKRALLDDRSGRVLTFKEAKRAIIELWVLNGRILTDELSTSETWGATGLQVESESGKSAFYLPSVAIEGDIRLANVLKERLFCKAQIFKDCERDSSRVWRTYWSHFIIYPDSIYEFLRLRSKEDDSIINVKKSSALATQYLVNSQLHDGSYVYNTNTLSKVRVQKNVNPVRMIGCTLALAKYSDYMTSSRKNKNLDRCIKSGLMYIRDFIDLDNGIYISPDSGYCSLGFVSMTLSLFKTASTENFNNAKIIGKLIELIVKAQKHDGSFSSNILEPSEDQSKDFAPGQAIIALIESGNREALGVVRKAFTFYSKFKVADQSKFFLAWQAKAWSKAFLKTNVTEYANFAFSCLDRLSKLQILNSNDYLCSDFIGGYREKFSSNSLQPPSFLVALFTEAFVYGRQAADSIDCQARKLSYTENIVAGSIFLNKLQISKRQCELYGNKSHYGAIRENISSFWLRCDYTMHGLSCWTAILNSGLDLDRTVTTQA